jgi:hypothetical protein
MSELIAANCFEMPPFLEKAKTSYIEPTASACKPKAGYFYRLKTAPAFSE